MAVRGGRRLLKRKGIRLNSFENEEIALKNMRTIQVTGHHEIRLKWRISDIILPEIMESG